MYQRRQIPDDFKRSLLANQNNRSCLQNHIFSDRFQSSTPVKDACLYGAPVSLLELNSDRYQAQSGLPPLPPKINIAGVDFDMTINWSHVSTCYKMRGLLVPQLLLPRGSQLQLGQLYIDGVIIQLSKLVKNPQNVLVIVSYNPDPFTLADFMELVLAVPGMPTGVELDALRQRIIICSVPLVPVGEKGIAEPDSGLYQGKNAQMWLAIEYLRRHGVKHIERCYLYDDSPNNIGIFTREALMGWPNEAKNLVNSSMQKFSDLTSLLEQGRCNIKAYQASRETPTVLDFSDFGVDPGIYHRAEASIAPGAGSQLPGALPTYTGSHSHVRMQPRTQNMQGHVTQQPTAQTPLLADPSRCQCCSHPLSGHGTCYCCGKSICQSGFGCDRYWFGKSS